MATQVRIEPDGAVDIRIEDDGTVPMNGNGETKAVSHIDAVEFMAERLDPMAFSAMKRRERESLAMEQEDQEEKARLTYLGDRLAETDSPGAHAIAEVEEGLGLAAKYRRDPLEDRTDVVGRQRLPHLLDVARDPTGFDEALDDAIEETKGPSESPIGTGWNNAPNPYLQWRIRHGNLEIRTTSGDVTMPDALTPHAIRGLENAVRELHIPFDRVQVVSRPYPEEEVKAGSAAEVPGDGITGWCPHCDIGLPRGVFRHENCPVRDGPGKRGTRLDKIEALLTETVRVVTQLAVKPERLTVSEAKTHLGIDGQSVWRPQLIGSIEYRPTEDEMKAADEVAADIFKNRKGAQDEVGGLAEATRLLHLAGCRIEPTFWDNKVHLVRMAVRWAKRIIEGEAIPYPETLSLAGLKYHGSSTTTEASMEEVHWLRRLGFDADGNVGSGIIRIDVPAAKAHIEITRLRDVVRERGWSVAYDDGAKFEADMAPYDYDGDEKADPTPHIAVLTWTLGHTGPKPTKEKS